MWYDKNKRSPIHNIVPNQLISNQYGVWSHHWIKFCFEGYQGKKKEIKFLFPACRILLLKYHTKLACQMECFLKSIRFISHVHQRPWGKKIERGSDWTKVLISLLLLERVSNSLRLSIGSGSDTWHAPCPRPTSSCDSPQCLTKLCAKTVQSDGNTPSAVVWRRNVVQFWSNWTQFAVFVTTSRHFRLFYLKWSWFVRSHSNPLKAIQTQWLQTGSARFWIGNVSDPAALQHEYHPVFNL